MFEQSAECDMTYIDYRGSYLVSESETCRAPCLRSSGQGLQQESKVDPSAGSTTVFAAIADIQQTLSCTLPMPPPKNACNMFLLSTPLTPGSSPRSIADRERSNVYVRPSVGEAVGHIGRELRSHLL